MFGTEPAKINHLGVETETAAESRLADSGLATTGVDETVCCSADKTETWVHAPDGNRWEWYVKHGDTGQFVNTVVSSKHRFLGRLLRLTTDRRADLGP